MVDIFDIRDGKTIDGKTIEGTPSSQNTPSNAYTPSSPHTTTPGLARSYAHTWHYGYADFNYDAAVYACELMKMGYSPRGAAGGIGIPYGSLMKWMANPLFGQMMDVAAAERVFNLETQFLNTKDLIKYKVIGAALKRAAPEAWEETRILPSDQNKQLPKQINITVMEAPTRSSMVVLENDSKGVLN